MTMSASIVDPSSSVTPDSLTAVTSRPKCRFTPASVKVFVANSWPTLDIAESGAAAWSTMCNSCERPAKLG